MQTKILRSDRESLEEITSISADIWQKGGLVAFPTETVYGLGANGLSAVSSRKIYEAKGRPSDNPLILHIGEKSQLYPLVLSVSEKTEKLIDAFWPGPLTIILKKSQIVPDAVSGGLDTVAVRMPSHPLANALLKVCRLPIAAPSANLSGRPSPTTPEHVIEDMNGRIDAIICDGSVGIGVESTIVDMTGEIPMILRPGHITKAMVEEVIGEVLIDPAVTRENIIHHTVELSHPKAPGMKYRHYAPKAPVTVVYGPEEKVIEAIVAKASEHTGILTVDEHMNRFPRGVCVSSGTRKDPDSVARGLFKALRAFDGLNVTEIFAEDFTDVDEGGAVMNRLLKAAGGNYRRYDEI